MSVVIVVVVVLGVIVVVLVDVVVVIVGDGVGVGCPEVANVKKFGNVMRLVEVTVPIVVSL